MSETCRFFCGTCNQETKATLSFGGNPRTCKVECSECNRSVIFSRYAVGVDIVIVPKHDVVIIPVNTRVCYCKDNFGNPLKPGQLHEAECAMHVQT